MFVFLGAKFHTFITNHEIQHFDTTNLHAERLRFSAALKKKTAESFFLLAHRAKRRQIKDITEDVENDICGWQMKLGAITPLWLMWH